MAVLAPHEAQVLEFGFSAHVDGVEFVEKGFEVRKGISAAIEEGNRAFHVREMIGRGSVWSVGSASGVLRVVVHLEASRLLNLEPMGDHFDASVGVDVIVECALFGLEHAFSGPSKQEEVRIVHKLREERFREYAAPKESRRKERFAPKNAVHNLRLKVDHSVHNAMVKSSHRRSRR